MSKSAILSSSIAKKWWMALTGLFLCLFLVGHLLGNLQLIFITGEEGKRAFNEYAFFMTHNPLIKVMSYLTYFSILFHAIDGILLTIQNKKARPQNYAYNKPNTNSKLPSRYMALLGSAILIFIVTHMANFWGKMHFDEMPLHSVAIETPMGNQDLYVTTNGGYVAKEGTLIKNGTEFYNEEVNLKVGEGYKDLHSVVMSFFGHDKSTSAGLPANEYALIAVLLYVLAMGVLGFHLYHGFSAAFQSLGINHKRITPAIQKTGIAFSILVPLAFAVIPVIIYMWSLN